MNSKKSLDLGNLLYEGNYSEVIRQGELYIQNHPDDAGVHVMLMDAYFKMRNKDWKNVQRSANHAKIAILFGHDTGYCHERLLKNLREMEYYYQALQLCNMILHPDFEFSSRGCGKKEYFDKAKGAIQKQIDKGKAKDNADDIVFCEEQIAQIIEKTRQRKAREVEAKKVWAQAQAAWEAGRQGEYDRLLKQYHKLQELI